MTPLNGAMTIGKDSNRKASKEDVISTNYRHSFLFVSTTEAEQQERAFTLGLAGLLGEGVYNFGELVRDNISLHYMLYLWTYYPHFPSPCTD